MAVNLPFRNLLSLMHNRFLTTSAAKNSSTSQLLSSSFTVNYLMNSCGLPLESALSTSQKLKLEENNLQRPQAVLAFLKSHGFDNTHIAELIKKRPKILQSKVEDNLKPKIEFLTQNGFVGKLLADLIVLNPVILRRGLSSHIKPSFHFLNTYLDNNENVMAAVKRSSWLLTYDLTGILQPNIDFLIREGVPLHSISKMILTQPRTIMRKVNRLEDAVQTLKKLGLEPTSPLFMHAFRVLVSMKESTWSRKMEVLKSLGWSEEDIWSVFKSNPLCLACSEEKMRSAMDFYVNTMEMDVETIIRYPRFLMYAVDKRLRPRYNVLKVLKSKNVLKEGKNYAWLLTQNENTFYKNYVVKHSDSIPGLMELYHGITMAENKDS
ncbi:hypothetical protein ACJW30_11G138100 [Castanea mollissima]